jgi:hypothetical protein
MEDPTLDMIRESWFHLRPLMQAYINRPSVSTEKEVADEMIKFDTIIRGNFHGAISLFRESLAAEKWNHCQAKTELNNLKAELSRVYKTLPASPVLSSIQSPIEMGEESE